MADRKMLRHGDFLLKLGDGAASEEFTAPAFFRSTSLTMTNNTSEGYALDTTNPAANPPWRLLTVNGRFASIAGTGILNMDDEDVWRTWFMSGQEKNVQLHHARPLADNGGHYAAPFIYTSATYTADFNAEAGKVMLQVALESAGPLAFVPASS